MSNKSITTQLNENAAVLFLHDFLESKWESGQCASCGWHAGLYEYDIPEDVTIDMMKREIHLPCRSKDQDGSGHRGVCIYF